MAPNDEPSFSLSTVAVLVALLDEKGVKLGQTSYERMSALDGTRTASSFDHQFRKVKAKAKDIVAQDKTGEAVTPTPKARGGSKASTPATGEKKAVKRGTCILQAKCGTRVLIRIVARKTPAKSIKNEDSEDESPSKKLKGESDGAANVSGNDDDGDDNGLH